MAIFDFIRNLFGGGEPPTPDCPHCGFEYGWNGKNCTHCKYPNHSTDSGPVVRQAGHVQAIPVAPQPPVKSSELTGLEVEKFAPIAMDDALQQTKSADWKSAYMDPLNVIPSASLARIRVIDQTMVGLGLISSDELAQIHKVGEEFDVYRTDAQVIQAAGERAVQQSKAEKARIKQQKKEEAAERKKSSC